jgi:hypothetical protein
VSEDHVLTETSPPHRLNHSAIVSGLDHTALGDEQGDGIKELVLLEIDAAAVAEGERLIIWSVDMRSFLSPYTAHHQDQVVRCT